MACSVGIPWYSLIVEEKKRVEGRLNKGIFADLKVGDLFLIHNKDDMSQCVNTKIVAIHKAKDFKELYERFGEKLLPKEGLNFGEDDSIYLKYYKEIDIQKHGVIGIEFELIE